MSETNKDIAVAFYKAIFEGRVEDAFRLYAGGPYRQHNPLIEDGMEGLKKFVTWVTSNHPDARYEIKRVFAEATTLSSTVIGTACPIIRRRSCRECKVFGLFVDPAHAAELTIESEDPAHGLGFGRVDDERALLSHNLTGRRADRFILAFPCPSHPPIR